MRHVMWSIALAVVGMTALADGAEVAPMPRRVLPVPAVAGVLRATIEPAGRYKVGDTFDQEVVFTRRSAVRVAGLDVAQASQYAVTSAVTVTAVNPDGSLAAEQVVRATKLLNSDPDLAKPLAAALAKAVGTRFEVAVDPAGGVTGFKAPKDPIRVLEGGNPLVGQSLRLWSLVDADGWRELAGLTFFQPPRLAAGNKTWDRPVTHDWGPLGGWRGKVVYAPVKLPKKATGERYDYRYDIYYQPPAAGADQKLPVRVTAADFRTGTAGGAIAYDPATRRVTAAEETFPVRGAVKAAAAGVDVVAELEEVQTFQLRIVKPADRALVGKLAPAKPGPPK